MFRTRKVRVFGVFSIVFLLSLLIFVHSSADEPADGFGYLPMLFVNHVWLSDDDHDGILDAEDDCPDTPSEEPVNERGCSIGDICHCSGPWEDHNEFVSCVSETSEEFKAAGLISEEQRIRYTTEAAELECPLAPGGDNYTNYGDPNPPPTQRANDTFEISFAVTGDPQFDNMYESWAGIPFCSDKATDKLLTSQKTVLEINRKCKEADPECIGIIVAGDLTQTTCVQQIIAFRQLFEYGYPGDDGGAIACQDDDYHNRYSWDYDINYPMFPMIGNHDDKSEQEDGCDCFDDCLWCRDDNDDDCVCHTDYVEDYIHDLVVGDELYTFPIEKRVSGSVPENWYRGNYAWEWGSFHFISLGLWAFYDGYDDTAPYRDSVDPDKIDWLKRHLAAIGHEKAVVLFQHFGWDERDGIWWSSDNSEQIINVLCNRDSSDEPCGTKDKPRYNIIGIFSGHSHEVIYNPICAERNSSGKCVVQFENYIVNDAGPRSNGEGTGFTIVHLNVWPEGYERHTEKQMTVTDYNLENFDFSYNYDGSENGSNHSSYDLVTHSTHAKTGITTGLTTWDQGEPNGYRYENCASFKSNGRFNDLKCQKHLRFLCRDWVTNELHLLSTQGEWEHGEILCEDSGDNRAFSLPRTIEEQTQLMQMIMDSGDSSAIWINKSDQIEEGHWIVYPQDYFYFEPGQPNDGSHLNQDKSHGEDCAYINEDGMLEDGRCENEMHNYVCKDNDGWKLHTEKGMWKQAFDEDKCGEHGFGFPADPHEYSKMYNDLKTDLEKHGGAWVSLNDIVEEGNWVHVNWEDKCWGLAIFGQTALPHDSFRQITSGNHFSCGIRLNGTGKCWGDNHYGQQNVPADIFLQISAGQEHICGVKKDHTVVCWGSNEDGKSNPPTGKFRQVSGGGQHSCGIGENGELVCWGNNDYGQLDAPSGVFDEVSAGLRHTCAVRSDNGELACWGMGYDGVYEPPKGKFRQVNSGRYHSCAVGDDKTLACWGDNLHGKANPPSGSFLEVDCGDSHSCGIREDGTLVCWGDNEYNQLYSPSGTFHHLSVGANHSCSVNSFVHPWEDDFPAGQENNEDEDCTQLVTWTDGGDRHGEWQDKPCDAELRHFACRSYETGDWKISPEKSYGIPWESGFDECIDNFGSEWRFDSPMTKADNARLRDKVWDQFREPVNVWLNYTDTRSEGQWRHAYWENWVSGRPFEEDCAAISQMPEDGWLDISCHTQLTFVCDMGDHLYFYPYRDTWENAVDNCAQRGGILLQPMNKSENDVVSTRLFSDPYHFRSWIRFSDSDYEGHWEDWKYGD